MGVLSDWQIEALALHMSKPMIVPYAPGVKRPGVISYGTSSNGYDVRVGYKFQIFDVINGTEIDPKNFDPKLLRNVDLNPGHLWADQPFDNGHYGCLRCEEASKPPDANDDSHGPCPGVPKYVRIPPHSFVLAESIETFNIPRDVLVVVVGKSTLARCGLIVNVTPGEPEWPGKWTIELSNTTPLPMRVYAGEGIMQCLFFRADQQEQIELIFDHLGQPFQRQMCKLSYLDKKGKYTGQTGVTTPIVK